MKDLYFYSNIMSQRVHLPGKKLLGGHLVQSVCTKVHRTCMMSHFLLLLEAYEHVGVGSGVGWVGLYLVEG